jgi:hypothetical protein
MQYQVINLGNIKGAEGEWEVNDAHYTGVEVSLPDDPDGRDIIDALKAAGVCAKHCQLRWLDIDMDSLSVWILHDEASGAIYIRQLRNGRWLWELLASTNSGSLANRRGRWLWELRPVNKHTA